LEGNQLKWDFSLESDRPLEVKNIQARLILKRAYKDWFSFNEKGTLPLVYPWATYANAKLYDLSSLIGMYKTAKLPAVAFDVKQSKFLTDTVIQSSRTEESSALSFNSPQEGIMLRPGTNLLARSQVSVFDKKGDLLNYISKQKEELSIVKGNLRLFFDRGYLGLYYQNIPFTQGRGLSTTFTYQNKRYNSSQAAWDVEKGQDNKLEVVGSWQDLPELLQLWRLKFINEKEVECEVSLENKQGINTLNLDTAKIELSLRPDYRHWLTMDQGGKFRNVQNGGVILKDPATKFFGIYNEDKRSLPGVFFILNYPSSSLVQLHYCLDNRMLIYWTRLNNSNLSSKEQKSPVFKARIRLVSDNQELKELIAEQGIKEKQRKANLQNTHSLTKNNTRVFFDSGQGRIYWNNRELTSGFGFYTSVLVNSFWQDSQNVLWEVERVDDSTIIARGSWVDLPISQTWKISLINDRLIDWDVELDDPGGIKLQQVQANIMLNEDYRAIPLRGLLQAKSGDKSLSPNIKFILTDNSSLCHQPTVSKATFLNSKSDILGYHGIIDKHLKPGRYKNYFKGRIKIE
jgi:hypothetical protein